MVGTTNFSVDLYRQGARVVATQVAERSTAPRPAARRPLSPRST